jgi:hypothetical protein
MTHKFCDKCGKRITFDGDPEDCYSHKSMVFASYTDGTCVYKLNLDFCDDCFEEFRKSLYKEDKNE